MYLELCNHANEGVRIACTGYDLIDGRIQLVSDGSWYFLRRDGSGHYLLAGKSWQAAYLNADNWELFPLIAHDDVANEIDEV